MKPFSINTFLGTLPKLAPKLISDNHAQVAHNCFVDSGRLVPIKAPVASELIDNTLNPDPETIYNLDDSWLVWDVDVDIERSIIPDIYEEVIEQPATGGSALTVIDTGVNFKASGVELGMTVKNITDSLEGTILDISTTTNPNDTLLIDSSINCDAGDIYQIINEETADFRFYYTGDGPPKQSTKSLAFPVTTTAGPQEFYNLGLRKPSTVPTLTKSGTPSGTVEKTLSYTYTLVNIFGEESQPATSTEPLDVEGGEVVTISNIDVQAGTLDGTEYVRIYRSITGTSGAQYQLVDQLPITDFPTLTDTYEDTVTDDLLGAILSSQYYFAPPENMIGLCKFNNMVYAGFHKNTIYLTEPNKPHAWPHTFDLPYEIVSIQAFDNQLVVATTHTPYVLTGTDPLAVSVNPLPLYQPSYGKKTMVSTPYGVIYICPDGIMQIQNAVTYGVLSKSILPKSYFCETRSYILGYVDHKLFIANEESSTGGFLLLNNLQAGLFTYGFTNYSNATGWYTYRNQLYLIAESANNSDYICAFNSGDNLVMNWQSKDIAFRQSGDYQNGKIVADGEVAFSFNIDGIEVEFPSGDKRVLDSSTFRLPSGRRGRVFSFTLCSPHNIDYAGLGDFSHEFA